jgi:serine/threonine-protein kinase HipA
LDKKLPPEEKWINRLYNPGSSMGGARPKACVLSQDNNVYVAKFPSVKDEYDVGKWEYLANLLAKDCGINTADAKLLRSKDGYSIFLSKRFDRNSYGQRIHMASSLTLLGLKDGAGANTGNGYLDIVDFIVSEGIQSEKQLEELFRRVAFNICIGNTDDHFRNHAFVLTKNGWELSPAYDMNPTRSMYQSLNINGNSNQSDINLLYKSHEEYLIGAEKAREIINDVVKTVKYWESLATTLKINSAEQRIIRDRLDLCQECEYGFSMKR